MVYERCFVHKLFFRAEWRDGAAGGAKNKNYQSRARKTTAVKRQTLPRGCSSKHARINIQVENGKKNVTVRNLETKSKGENTWEKTEYKPFFDSGNHIFFQKWTIFYHFDKKFDSKAKERTPQSWNVRIATVEEKKHTLKSNIFKQNKPKNTKQKRHDWKEREQRKNRKRKCLNNQKQKIVEK